jgi:hypothetical protein
MTTFDPVKPFNDSPPEGEEQSYNAMAISYPPPGEHKTPL